MKGMELSKAYFDKYGRKMIDENLAEYREYIAAGLVGEGSECFGFDDEISTDHDFGPAFCIWIPYEIYRKVGASIQKEYDNLPGTYMGYTRIFSAQGGGRIGVIPIEGFYKKFTGLEHAPKDNLQWFRIPENFLATATNGEVFVDNYGQFSQIREVLQGFYPLDVVKKKLASRCALIAQSGQYNYSRCMKRGDSYAAYLACNEFVKNAMGAIYLLNEKYMPYYKWIFKGAEHLQILSDAVHKIKEIILIPDTYENRSKKEILIESVSTDIARQMNLQGLTRTYDTFLQAHGEELMRSIDDSRLRSMHIMIDHN